MHCSYSVLGAWCRSHACPKGSFKASPPQSKPYAISDPCPCSKNSLHVLCLHCLGAALVLPVRRPLRCLCAALTLLVRCMCAACAPHARCLWAAMRAAYALPCAPPVYPTIGNMHVLEPVHRVPTACLCLAVPPRPRRGAPMAWP